jgi:hypothetical protein
MEPIKINVNVEVSLSEATIAALKGMFGARIIAAPAKVDEPAPEPEKAAEPMPDPAPAPAADDDDLPPDDAPAPVKAANIPTEAEMRAAIQATRKRGVAAKTIKDYIRDTFGVETSVECPEERRQELMDGLKKLAA